MQRSTRFSLLLFALLLLGSLCPEALGHGDSYRDPRPGDTVPPFLRDPPDPTPPPPPPPGPGVPPPARPPLAANDWFFWWQGNAGTYEHVKWHLYCLLGGSDGPFERMTDRVRMRDRVSAKLTMRQTRELAVPALLRLVEQWRSRDPHVSAGAHLALGKVAHEEAHVRRLLATARDEGAWGEVEKGALIGLGNLRREDVADPFPAALLDEVREALLGVLEDGWTSSPARGCAALALGLLHDQPIGGEDEAAARREITSRLFRALAHAIEDEDLASTILLAISLQPPETTDARERKILTGLGLLGRQGIGKASELTAARCLHALGRVGGFEDLGVLRRVLFLERHPAHKRRCAALGIAALGRRLEGKERAACASALRASHMYEKDPVTRGLVHVSVAKTLAAGLTAGELDLLDKKVVTATMLRALEKGTTVERGYAALALGHLARAVTDEMDREGVHRFRESAIDALQGTLADASVNRRVRAASVIALGMAQHLGSRDTLRDMLAAEDLDVDTRASAAWALGLIRQPDAAVVKALHDAARTNEPVELRRRAVRALAMLGHPLDPRSGKDAVDLLLQDLAGGGDPVERVDTVVLLARFGDHRAIAPLVAVLEDPDEKALVRALAASALGAVGDLEYVAGLDLLRWDAYHLGRGPLLDQVFKFL